MSYSKLLKYTSPMMPGEDVKEVQTRNRVSVDGIVGPNTWNKLVSSSAVSNRLEFVNEYELKEVMQRLDIPGKTLY